jgi:F-type H+-transporting ATPase subunit epsilon
MAEKNRYPVEILTPEGLVFSGDVEMLATRTEVGEIGVLANHTPLLAMLAPTELRLHMGGGEIRRFAQGEGYLQVHSNHALVLVEDCFDPERIDRPEQQEKLKKAQEIVDEAQRGSAEERQTARFRQAERDKRRAEAFLRISADGS